MIYAISFSSLSGDLRKESARLKLSYSSIFNDRNYLTMEIYSEKGFSLKKHGKT
jgi:hypothetical protein